MTALGYALGILIGVALGTAGRRWGDPERTDTRIYTAGSGAVGGADQPGHRRTHQPGRSAPAPWRRQRQRPRRARLRTRRRDGLARGLATGALARRTASARDLRRRSPGRGLPDVPVGSRRRAGRACACQAASPPHGHRCRRGTPHRPRRRGWRIPLCAGAHAARGPRHEARRGHVPRAHHGLVRGGTGRLPGRGAPRLDPDHDLHRSRVCGRHSRIETRAEGRCDQAPAGVRGA